jgi:3-hydroxyisobutyrate dehydrogenase-like beta-hydroxyacid dehydrogenase
MVGLGLVGTALGQRLQAPASRCWVTTCVPRRCADWAATATVGDSLARPGQPLPVRVVLAVFDTRGVLEVVEGLMATAGEAASRAEALIDCSTGDPEALQAWPPRLAAARHQLH